MRTANTRSLVLLMGVLLLSFSSLPVIAQEGEEEAPLDPDLPVGTTKDGKKVNIHMPLHTWNLLDGDENILTLLRDNETGASEADIRRDHDDFVSGSSLTNDVFPSHFDGLRRIFLDRLEYDRFRLKVDRSSQSANQLAMLGFQLEQ